MPHKSHHRRIFESTDAFMKKMGISLPPQTLHSHATLQAFKPSIPDIQYRHLDSGVSPELTALLHRSYHTKAEQRYLNDVSQSFNRLASLLGGMNDEQARTVSRFFHRHLRICRNEAMDRLMSELSIVMNEKTHRPSFKSESVPLLENYFKRNAYPSTSDRILLAERTRMTPRQIEVWFQNHRNRRKNMQSLKRLAHSISFEDLLDDLPHSSTIDSSISDSEREPSLPLTPPVRPHEPLRPTKLDLLNPPAPKHAFPAVFPPKCDYDPFPVKESGQCQLPAFQWMRVPCQTDHSKRKKLSLTAVDELAEKFAAGLKLHGGNSRKRPRDAMESEEPATSWRIPTYVYVCRGRHPAVHNVTESIYRPHSSTLVSPERPSKRFKSSQSITPRTSYSRYSTSNSNSSCSSSSQPVTPTGSPFLDFQQLDLPFSSPTNSNSLPVLSPRLFAFGQYAGPLMPFRLCEEINKPSESMYRLRPPWQIRAF